FALLTVCTVLTSACAPAAAQTAGRLGVAASQVAANPSVNIGAVRPSNLVLPQLAVTDLPGAAGAAAAIGQTVSADLALADIASPPSNTAAVMQAESADRQAGGFSYDGWTRAGVNYVVRIGAGERGGAQAELYD